MWPQSLYDGWHLTNKKSFKMLTPSTSLLLYNIRSQSCFTSGLLLSILELLLMSSSFFFLLQLFFLCRERSQRGSVWSKPKSWAKLSPSYSLRSLKLTVLSLILLSLPFFYPLFPSFKTQSGSPRNLSNGPWPSQPSVRTLRGKWMGSTQNRMITFTDCLPTPPLQLNNIKV